MCGRGRVFGLLGFTLVFWLAGSLTACNKEDVAPQMQRPGGGWDGPVQESPEPPPSGMGNPDEGGAMKDEVPEPPPPEDVNAADAPPTGEDIPLGAPPLPEGVKGVTVSGTVTYDGYEGGLIQIDVSDKGMQGGNNRGERPKIIRLYRLEKPGPFQMDVPENQGKIWISAYNDADKNGRPSREEPRGNAHGNPFSVGTEPITGVTIELAKEKIPPPP